MMIRIGIVGLGFMGQQHFAIYDSTDNVEVVAVCDQNPDKVAETAPSIGGNIGEATELDLSAQARYVCFDDMLAKEELDCADVCVPTHLHAELAVAALEAGCHVISEKPMARTLEECDQMIAAAEATGQMLFIAQCIRFWPEYQLLADMLNSGELGRLAAAKFTRQSPTPTWSEAGWLLDPGLSGGAMLDLHIHDVDFILSLWGKPPAVLSRASNLLSEGNKVDHVVTSYLYDDFVCVAEGGWAMPAAFPFEMGFQVLGEKGLLDFSLAKQPMLTFYPRDGEPYSPEVATGTGYERELGYFIQCMENDQPPERVTAQSARESVAVVMAEQQSAQTGEVVELD